MRIIENKYLTIRPSKSKPMFIFVALPKPTGGHTSQRIYIKKQPSLEKAWEVARNLRDRLGKQYWGKGFDVRTSNLIGESMVTVWPTKPKPDIPRAKKTSDDVVLPIKGKQKETIVSGAHRQLFDVVPGVTEVFSQVPIGSPPVGMFKVDYEDKHGSPSFYRFQFGCRFPRLDAMFAALKCKEEIERNRVGRTIKCRK